MIRLVYSNRAEELLGELASAVREQQRADGPLVPVRVVVPSASLEAYVRVGVARAQGIAANLDVMLLTRLAEQVAAPRAGRIADATALEAMLLELLLDDGLLADPALAPVRRYLGAGGDDGDATDARRVQLAGRVGRLFEEYTYSRGDMLAAWATGDARPDAGENEAWQRRLWRGMFSAEGLARAKTPPLTPLHEAVAAFSLPPGAARGALHVFGFAHVAQTFHALLGRLGAALDVVVYSLSPCEGLWEERDAHDPSILSLWGRPGRDNARALNAIAGFDHDDRFVDPLAAGSPTLLRQVQSDILRRAPGGRGDAERARGDESLLILEHASVRRECEAVASAIWAALEADPTLRLDEVAVLVPPRDAPVYTAHLAATFREAYGLPHQIVGIPEAAPSRVSEAIELLLALPLGTFSRPELLRLAVHPLVAATLGDPDPSRWVAYCEALGIVHGADRADHDGTYVDRDLLSWDQGLRRLALGTLMAGEPSGDPSAVTIDGETYLPLEVPGSELHDAASLGILARSLIADARFARGASLSPRDWSLALGAMIEAYLTPSTDAEGDELARRLRQVGSLGDLDLGGRTLGYRAIHELLGPRLGAAPLRRGEGVVVSTIAAARGIPFRLVFACGLGEGKFPSSEGDDALDLRSGQRLPGDSTPRERDRYALLEVLLGTRDRLALSFVSRDALTGDALPPSSVVEELARMLGDRYVADVETLRRRHPLRRWDPRYFPDLFGGAPSSLGTMALPEARAEAQSLALRDSARAAHARPSLETITERASAGEPAWEALAGHLGLAPLAPSRSADPKVVVPMSVLVKFLEQPLQGWARLRLGFLQEDEVDLVARDAEPLETSPRDATLLLRDILFAAAAAGRPVEDVYDETVAVRAPKGLGPSGLFARSEREEHLRAIEVWRAALETRGTTPGALEVHRVGPGRSRGQVHQTHDALTLELDVPDERGVVRMLKVTVTGTTLPMARSPRMSVTLAKRATDTKDDWGRAGRRRSTIRAFVDHAVLTAAGAAGPGEHEGLVIVATPEDPLFDHLRFPALSADAARGWLRDVLRDLLGEAHAYFLPCEAAFVHAARGATGSFAAALGEARERRRGGEGPGLGSSYGHVPHPERQPLPDEARARAMVERRLGPILSAKDLGQKT